uniref:NADH-ubiquinone oxidoreductase chain 6 n=1 Tax=Diplometopon zarudnyi TaxID=94420 RepID=Q66SW5_DIPZA|nr:NADH dehydrogenase subunit 6 [Diplometopon zarudnyi]AAT08514.1 NADH dehydrogenase subunit 6 [Diplometopon zarudnyi]
MMYLVYLLGVAFLVSVCGVASNPLPQYSAGMLVLAAAFSCATLSWIGGSFVSLILLLIYLGGMLVVFAYSVTLTSGSHVGAYGNWPVGVRLFVFLCMVLYMLDMWLSDRGVVQVDSVGLGEFSGPVLGLADVQVDLFGVPLLYCSGSVGLLLCISCLFICLFAVLGLTRGGRRGGMRPF